MRRYLLLLLILAPACGLRAQTGDASIHHCVASNGTPVYTDQPCASLDASLIAIEPGTSETSGTSSPRAAMHARGRPAPSGPQPCPASIDDLKQRIAHAFRSRDPNALAGLMLWRGWHSRGAVAQVRDLRSLIRRPLLGFVGDATDVVHTYQAFAGLPPLVPPSRPVRPAPGTITLELGDHDGTGTRQASFALVPRDGCVWLQP